MLRRERRLVCCVTRVTNLSTLIVREHNAYCVQREHFAEEIGGWVQPVRIIWCFFFVRPKIGLMKGFVGYQSSVLISTEHDMKNGKV